MLVGVLLLVVGILGVCDGQEIRSMLNTKSPYPGGAGFRSSKDFDVDCINPKLIHYNLLARHGTRFPTTGDLNNFAKLQKKVKDILGQQIQNPNYNWIKSWVSPYNPNYQGLLSDVGEWEHYNISKRFLSHFGDFFTSPYTALSYPIQCTQVPRTSRSASSFTFGLWEGKGNIGPSSFEPVAITSESANQDLTLRFFDNCPLYQSEIASNSSAALDSSLYLKQYSPQILQKVSNVLQLPPFNNLTFSDVSVMYKICAFEVSSSIYNQFCSLFDHDDLSHFETSNDLSDYYIKGYGYPINYQISCPLLVDFWTSIQNAIKPGNIEKAKLRFAHAETVLPFASLLGLFKDDFTLKWDSPNLSQRKWRTSIVSPFAANIGVGLYDCSGTYKLQIFHNEIEQPFPGCGGTYYCPLSTVEKLWQNALQCDFIKLCSTVV
uniref:Multiple inositol polyphosphate phosphatase 1 n=1 Tax=Arcella intermedia TaxID=1963864 RepID=A0A6B2L4L5_9EUKA